MKKLSLPFSNRDELAGKRKIVHFSLRSHHAKWVKEIARQGDPSIQILGASDQDCPACTRLDGQIFKASHLPALPPDDCSCLPYCTCILTILSRENEAPVS